jgi:hypothetical protein
MILYLLVCNDPHLYMFGEVGVAPSIATKLTVYGQGGPQGAGVTPECCWVKVVQADVGAPLENAKVSLIKQTADKISRVKR